MKQKPKSDATIIDLDSWLEAVSLGIFLPDDGFGFWVGNDGCYLIENDSFDHKFYGDKLWEKPPAGATGVAWYNK